MKIIRKIIKALGLVLLLPLAYLIIAFTFSNITWNNSQSHQEKEITVYLHTNGVHLDIIIPKKYMNKKLSKDLIKTEQDNYFSFGWGDENFYLNTPTWNDLSLSNACSAMFLESSTLMHVTRYRNIQKDWVEVELSTKSMEKLNTYINLSFSRNKEGGKKLLKGEHYFHNDNFYKAKGSYSCFKTCNSWVNTAFLKSDMKACLWTPFDFSLIKIHK